MKDPDSAPSPLILRPSSPKPTSLRLRPRFYAIFVVILIVLCTLALQYKMASGITRADEKGGRRYTLGFAMSPTYGTVAIRDNHGRLLAQAKVDVDKSYIRMLERLNLESSRHSTPPYTSLWEIFLDYPRQMTRKYRKKLGLTASFDVARLAGLISQLKAAAEEQLSSSDFQDASCDGAILTLPSVIALYAEDACDTLEYLGIKNLAGTHIAERQLRPISAAFYQYGFGSCEHWRDPDACVKEWIKRPVERTLLVEYSRMSLSVDWVSIRGVYRLGQYDEHRVIVDFGAGSEHAVDGLLHWHRIREHIEFVVDSQNMEKAVTLVLLAGESAQDGEFQETVRAAVAAYGEPTIHINDDPIYVAAHGTSDRSWRAAEIQTLNPDKVYFPCAPGP